MRRAITRELYDRLIAAFRADPGRFRAAAQAAGCDPRTAKRGWDEGWESQHPWAVAIKSVVEQDALIARAKVRELAAEDASDSRAVEAVIVRRARANVAFLLEESSELIQRYPELVQAAAKKLRALAQDDGANVDELLAMAERALRFQHGVNTLADQVMRLERKLLGEPEEVIGVMSAEDAAREIEESRAALERMRQRRGLPEPGGPVIDGNVEA